MSVYRFSAAEDKLLDQITDKDELIHRLPRMNTFFEGVQDMRTLVSEISVLGTFTKKTGFVAGKNFQRIASIPYSVAHAILEIDPDFWTNKAKVYRFLEAHPEYDTRSLVK